MEILDKKRMDLCVTLPCVVSQANGALGYYVALIILTTITVLISLYHEEIVEWLTPATRWLHECVSTTKCNNLRLTFQ